MSMSDYVKYCCLINPPIRLDGEDEDKYEVIKNDTLSSNDLLDFFHGLERNQGGE